MGSHGRAVDVPTVAAGAGPHDYQSIVNASTWVFVAVAVTAVLMLIAGRALPRGAVDAPAYAPRSGEARVP